MLVAGEVTVVPVMLTRYGAPNMQNYPTGQALSCWGSRSWAIWASWTQVQWEINCTDKAEISWRARYACILAYLVLISSSRADNRWGCPASASITSRTSIACRSISLWSTYAKVTSGTSSVSWGHFLTRYWTVSSLCAIRAASCSKCDRG